MKSQVHEIKILPQKLFNRHAWQEAGRKDCKKIRYLVENTAIPAVEFKVRGYKFYSSNSSVVLQKHIRFRVSNF